MAKGTSQVFAAGPPVVERGLGEKVTKEDLGGSQVHARGSGVVDNEAENEDDAFQQIRRFLSYLPANVYGVPPTVASDDDPNRRDEFLLSAIPRESRRPYNVRKILESILDRGSIFEIGAYQEPSIVTCLARLSGRSVGVLANDPLQHGGSLDAGGAEKIIRFVDMCDTFHIPMVNFVDQPGVMVGTAAAERFGIPEIIDPRDSRPLLCEWVEEAYDVVATQLGPTYRTMRS